MDALPPWTMRLGQAEYQRVNIFQRTPLDHWQTPIAVVACPPMLNPFYKTVFLGLLITSPLYAESKPQVFTAQQLAADCRKALALGPDGMTRNDVGPAWDCIGYVRGALDLLGWAGGAVRGLRETYYICVPDGVSLEQVMRVFVKFAEEHPEWLHKSAGMMFTMSLYQAFPCDSEEKPTTAPNRHGPRS